MGIQTWIARYRKKRALKKLSETAPPPPGSRPMLVPSGKTGTDIVYISPTPTKNGGTLTSSGGSSRTISAPQLKTLQKQQSTILKAETPLPKASQIKTLALQETRRRMRQLKLRPPKRPLVIEKRKRLEEEEIPKLIKRPPAVVTAEELPTERGPLAVRLADIERKKLRTERARGKKPSVERELKLAGLTIASSLIATVEGIKRLPAGIVMGVAKLIKDPKSIKKIPASIKKEGVKFGNLLRVSPTEAVAKVGAEILILKGTGTALKVTGTLSSKVATRLSPKFRGVKSQVINIPSKQVGKTINIEIGGTVKKLAEPLRKQIALAGKVVTPVSAQADRLIRLIKRTRVVRKPIPGEAKLSSSTKRLLSKFDKGKINKKDLIKLDQRIVKETGREGSLLERSFFADPRGRLRPSRLGVKQKEASLLDVLAGDVTFKTQKPQVLIFEKAKVEKFPKALKGIENKLKAGKPLSRNEANKLLQFQLKKSGKFKPVGHVSKEPEITLAPGEIIKKEKTIAVTLIKGKRVPIIRAKVIKATAETRKLLKKASEGIIKTKELKKLRINLRKETGFKTSFSRGRIGKPKVRIPKPRPRPPKPRPRRPRPPKPKPRPRPPKPKPRPRPPKPRPRPPKPRPPARPPKPRPPARPPRRVPRRPPKRPPARPPKRLPRIRPPIKPIPKRVKRRPPKKRPPIKPQAFEVWARPLKRTKKGRKPKLIKVSKVPLSKKRAKDLRNYITDTSLGRTARIRPSKGKITEPKLRTPKGYAKKSSAKFRRHKIRKGKRVPLQKGRVIERGRFLLDTTQEKKQITLRRRIAQLSKPPKKRKPAKRKTIKRRKSIKRDRGIFG